MSEKSNLFKRKNCNDNKILTIEDQDRIIDLYTRGMEAEDISDKLGFNRNQVRRIIKAFEATRKPPEELEKAYYRAPQVNTIIDPKTGKTYYDISDFMIDRPCIYSISK